jgi:hypothetical protein
LYYRFLSERGLPDQCEKFAALGQIVLETAQKKGTEDEQEISGLLADCHHHQSISALYTGTPGAMDHAKAWLAILIDRIEKWNLPSDALNMATAYNQLALCYIKVNNVKEAISSWRFSFDTYRNLESAPRLSGIWPATSLGLIYTLENRPEEANQVLGPILREREEVLGKDDTTTSEYVVKVCSF